MKKLYDVVSKATKINKITGAEIPAEVFHGPYTIVGHDEERFYMQHGNEGNFFPEASRDAAKSSREFQDF